MNTKQIKTEVEVARLYLMALQLLATYGDGHSELVEEIEDLFIDVVDPEREAEYGKADAFERVQIAYHWYLNKLWG